MGIDIVSRAAAAYIPGVPFSLQPQVEKRRLDAHFDSVLTTLGKSTARLLPSQAHARAACLRELARYQRRGRFPLNRDTGRARTPIFVDRYGTRCALGHLLDAFGAGALVDEVATSRNQATVAELTDLPALVGWLDAHGLTVDEAALIQPSYCNTPSDCVCDDANAPGVLEGVIYAADDGHVLQVSKSHGVDGYGVGDLVPIGRGVAVGERIFAGVRSGRDGAVAYVVARVPSFDDVQPAYCSSTPSLLTRDDYLAARFAGSEAQCLAVLGARNAPWTEERCWGERYETSDEEPSDGCSMSPLGSGALTSSSVLAAGAVILAWRRLSRR